VVLFHQILLEKFELVFYSLFLEHELVVLLEQLIQVLDSCAVPRLDILLLVGHDELFLLHVLDLSFLEARIIRLML